MEIDAIPRSVGVHNGKFHADEATACALLILFNRIDSDKIFRTRDFSILSRCEYRCDVGGEYDPSKKDFDHHQASYQGPMSSAGMVLSYLKDEGDLSLEEYDLFHKTLVIGIDAHDNGIITSEEGTMTISHIVSCYNPPDSDAPHDEQDRCFLDAVELIHGILQRLRRQHDYIVSCRAIIAEQMSLSKEYLIFDKSIPWQEGFFENGGEHHPALFVIMPSEGKWKLRGIPPLYRGMDVRVPLPEEWAGLLGHELRDVSGIANAVFCHKGRFIAVFKTREAALAALDYVLHKREGER